MTDSSFAALVRERETGKVAQLVKDGPPEDDAARPEGYEAVRRIRSFHFSDVIFRSHGDRRKLSPGPICEAG